jgi:hypothetical protein
MESTSRGLTLPGEITRWQSLVLATFILGGLVTAFAVPVGGGFDEIQHLRRAWEMSAFEFIPNSRLGSAMAVPAIFRELSYRELPIVRAVGPDYWERYGQLHLDSKGWSRQSVSTRSIYTPPLLLPQSLVLRYLGRKYDLPFLPTLSAMRISGLLAYSLLAYLAIRLVPFGKWAMVVLSVLPTSMFQAATVTADSISNGLAMLFIGGSLRIASQTRIDRKGSVALVALAALLFLAKANLLPLILLPFLLIRPSKFDSRILFALTILSVAALLLVEVVGWNLAAYPADGVMISPVGPVEHLEYFLRSPFRVAGSLLLDLSVNGADYLQGWVAATGYYYWPPSTIGFLLFAAALVISTIFADGAADIRPRTRWALLLTFIAAYAATALLLQVINTEPGSGEVRELQGRYLTGGMPLLFMALVGIRPNWPVLSNPLLAPLTILGLAAYVAGLVLAYHVPCGPSYYNLGTCLMPRYKNWAPWDHPTAPVTSSNELRQGLLVECDGLSELRLFVDASEAEGATTRFRVLSASGATVLDQRLTG